MNDALGDRMKRYEHAWRPTMPLRLPVIVRVDGRAFHTFTRGLEKPYDDQLRAAMAQVALALCKGLAGAKFAYTQSDEVSVLLTNNDTIDTQSWFDNDVVKMASIAASLATVAFNEAIPSAWRARMPHFDGRVFVVPSDDAVNYFIWRQKDWHRNSLSMLARSCYSQKEVQGVRRDGLHEMLHLKGVNWATQSSQHKDGIAVVPLAERGWQVETAPPEFTKDRSYIGQHIPGWVPT